MARIKASGGQKVLQITSFLGLNQNPDGDTRLDLEELSEMRNFSITADKHLQLRPGEKTLLNLYDAWNQLAVKPDTITDPKGCGLWPGLVDGRERLLAAYGGVLWELALGPQSVTPREVGRCTEDSTSFFGFGNQVYCLTGHEYLVWDGGPESRFAPVAGYIPTVVTACSPEGTGTLLENVNRLTGKRRVKFSPDGKATAYQLPENPVDEVVSVQGADIGWSLDAAKGIVTFSSAPPTGINSLSIVYRKGTGTREQVERMRYAEQFNGATDSRVFLYGDGSNRCIYSGNDLDRGVASAEYFPDLSEVAVGEENSPLTALIRHYDRMLAYKSDSTWSISSAMVNKPGGGVLPTFPVTSVHRSIGNEAPGQVRLLENNPLSFTADGIYQWKPGNNADGDRRNADRISQRVTATLASYDLSQVRTFNDLQKSEFWVLCGGTALILNYQTDTWSYYTNMPFLAMEQVEGQVYGLTEDGRLIHVSRVYRNDDTAEIDAYAETGTMDFGRDWIQKFSPEIFISIKPESGARITVKAETDRRSDYQEKVVASGLSNFSNVDFRHWSFGTNRKPRVIRVRMKVKKATYYKLIFMSKSSSATGTILGADIQARFAGKVR